MRCLAGLETAERETPAVGTDVAYFGPTRAAGAGLRVGSAGEGARLGFEVGEFWSNSGGEFYVAEAEREGAVSGDLGGVGLCVAGCGAGPEVFDIGGGDAEFAQVESEGAGGVGMVEEEDGVVAVGETAGVEVVVVCVALDELDGLAEGVLVDGDEVFVLEDVGCGVGHAGNRGGDHEGALEHGPEGEVAGLLGLGHAAVADFEEVHVGEVAWSGEVAEVDVDGFVCDAHNVHPAGGDVV